jgi:hypothetical protein
VAYVVILTKQCGLLKNGRKIRGETFLPLLVGKDFFYSPGAGIHF